MPKLSKVSWMIGAMLSAGAVVITACGNPTIACGPGTHLDTATMTICQPDKIVLGDMAMSGVMCGSNTAVNSANNSCEVTAGACGMGAMFDAASKTCKGASAPNYGTLVAKSTLGLFWGDKYYVNTMPTPDAGNQFIPVDPNFTCTFDPKVMDSEKLYMSDGTPIGFNGKLPVHWLGGNVSTTTTAIDHQLTAGEWKKCTANFAIYKNPPSGKKNYMITADVMNCAPNMLYTVWNTYGPDNEFGDITLVVPTGGVPNAVMTDALGNAHFERELDPNVWFKSNAKLPGSAHVMGIEGTIPDITKDTANKKASFWIDISLHNTGQPNGNAGFCEVNTIGPRMGLCTDAPSPNLYLPGNLTIDWAIAFAGSPGPMTGCPVNTAIPLAMIQPY